ncbi:MAG: hypothetical protein ABFS86_11915 [Planctomycetota bacterium]
MDRDERADRIDEIRLRRSRNLAGILRDLPRESLPADRAEEIRRAALAARPFPRVAVLSPFLRVAAALLLLAGAAAALLVATRDRYEPLELTVIDVHANGAHDEDLAFEHIYGPDGNATKFALVATDPR